jgi:hypothetical protein
VSKDRSAEREARKLRAQNTALKKQVSRLRKRLGRFAPVEESPDPEEASETPKETQVADEDACPQCGGQLTTLTTPGKTRVAFCKQKCGFRKKLT